MVKYGLPCDVDAEVERLEEERKKELQRPEPYFFIQPYIAIKGNYEGSMSPRITPENFEMALDSLIDAKRCAEIAMISSRDNFSRQTRNAAYDKVIENAHSKMLNDESHFESCQAKLIYFLRFVTVAYEPPPAQSVGHNRDKQIEILLKARKAQASAVADEGDPAKRQRTA